MFQIESRPNATTEYIYSYCSTAVLRSCVGRPRFDLYQTKQLDPTKIFMTQWDILILHIFKNEESIYLI